MNVLTDNKFPRREALLLLLILVFAFTLRMKFLHEVFERDEGQYAAIAQVILDGGVPYKDAIEIKPPGAFYLYALGIALFGATTESLRIFTAIYSMLTVLAVYGTARRFGGTKTGLWAALLYAIFSCGPHNQGSSSNTEVFLVLPITAATYFFMLAIDTGKRLPLIACSICSGASLLIKPVALPVVALLFIAVFFLQSSRRTLRDTTVNIASYLLPMISMAALTFGYFAYRGAWNEFIYWNIIFPTSYLGSGISGPGLQITLLRLTPELLVLVTFALPTAVWLLFSKRDIKSVVLALLFPAACIAIWLPQKYFSHYFILLVPILAILAGIGLAHAFRVKRLRLGAATLLLLTFFYWANKELKFFVYYTPEMISLMKYGPQFVEAQKLAKYLKERTQPDDYIFQWGLEPELYFLADRRSPNRNLVSVSPAWAQNSQDEINKMAQDIIQKQPRYIIMQPEWQEWPGIEEISYIVSKYYIWENFIAQCNVFRRR
jgi:4-amino-4-deoxy-L-arabinose transferase-like glycosyltransferase